MSSLIRDARLDKQPIFLPVGAGIVSLEAGRRIADQPALQQIDRSSAHVETGSHQREAIESLMVTESSSSVAAESLAAIQAEYAQTLKHEKEAAQREGKEQGYQEGYETGLNRGQAEYRERISRLEAVIAAAKDAIQQGIEGVEDVAVEIVFTAVCKMLGSALVDRDGTVALVQQVICLAKDREKLVVRVSPSDFHFMQDAQKEFMKELALTNGGLIPDERVVLGGCLLETAGGNLDGRLEIQLEQFREALLMARTRRLDDGDGS